MLVRILDAKKTESLRQKILKAKFFPLIRCYRKMIHPQGLSTLNGGNFVKVCPSYTKIILNVPKSIKLKFVLETRINLHLN